MKLICSDMLPVGLENGQQSIIDCIHEQFEKADQVELAVGYISKASFHCSAGQPAGAAE